MTHSNPQAPQVAAAAVVRKGNTVLLIKRGVAPNKGLWAIPGGSVELGETLQQAAEREVLEETGLTVKAGEAVHVFDYVERAKTGTIRFHYVIVDVVADYVSGEIMAAEELRGIDVSETTIKLLRKIQFL